MAKVLCTQMNRSDDLLQWANYLEALGSVVGSLAYYDDGEEVFHQHGQYLGMIISDYAKAIHDTLGDVYGELTQIFKGFDGSKIHKMKREVEWLKKWDHPDLSIRLDKLNENIEELKPISDDVIEMNCVLVNMKEAVVSQINELRQKRAPTSNTGQEEVRAQDDSEITVTHQEMDVN